MNYPGCLRHFQKKYTKKKNNRQKDITLQLFHNTSKLLCKVDGFYDLFQYPCQSTAKPWKIPFNILMTAGNQFRIPLIIVTTSSSIPAYFCFKIPVSSSPNSLSSMISTAITCKSSVSFIPILSPSLRAVRKFTS